MTPFQHVLQYQFLLFPWDLQLIIVPMIEDWDCQTKVVWKQSHRRLHGQAHMQQEQADCH